MKKWMWIGLGVLAGGALHLQIAYAFEGVSQGGVLPKGY